MNGILVSTLLVSGALAACLRFVVSFIFTARASRPDSRSGWFPRGVLVVNAIASLIAGIATGAAESFALSDDVRLVLVTGVAGGLSTFSTFSVDTIQLILAKRFGRAVAVVGANLGVGLAAVVLGVMIGRLL